MLYLKISLSNNKKVILKDITFFVILLTGDNYADNRK